MCGTVFGTASGTGAVYTFDVDASGTRGLGIGKFCASWLETLAFFFKGALDVVDTLAIGCRG